MRSVAVEINKWLCGKTKPQRDQQHVIASVLLMRSNNSYLWIITGEILFTASLKNLSLQTIINRTFMWCPIMYQIISVLETFTFLPQKKQFTITTKSSWHEMKTEKQLICSVRWNGQCNMRRAIKQKCLINIKTVHAVIFLLMWKISGSHINSNIETKFKQDARPSYSVVYYRIWPYHN